ncbi:hypothetical protein POTOM_043044 [Populus tomentosa]|uniref:RING-type domain-containing protein n=1 Tax=Populus tomentosa TaxID=118781 RepID=A0A8X7YNB4_POPTO|nr:hypothetical protein POTOM_043044 [Populus tomentosa]
MLDFASKFIRGTIRLKHDFLKPGQALSGQCSDDEPSLNSSGEDRLECPICWESFNIVENVPYVLWCGHSLCKNCVLGLQWALVKLPTLPILLPFFISCPWCNMLSFRSSFSSIHSDHQPVAPLNDNPTTGNHVNPQVRNRHAMPVQIPSEQSLPNRDPSYFNGERLHLSLRKSLVFFAHMTAKFPLIVMFLLIVLYAIPTSAAILALYILITLVFALPSFLILYFSLPSLDWLMLTSLLGYWKSCNHSKLYLEKFGRCSVDEMTANIKMV